MPPRRAAAAAAAAKKKKPAAAAAAKKAPATKGGKKTAAASKAPPASKAKASKASKAKQQAAAAVAESVSLQDQMHELAKGSSQHLRQHAKPDSALPDGVYSIYSDGSDTFQAMLNQTNVAGNNNKFYVIEVLTKGKQFFCWNRWGRIGETGQSKMHGPFSKAEDAIKEFSSKFKSKTGTAWADRDSIVPKAGKYTPVDLADDDGEDDEDVPMPAATASKGKKKVASSCPLEKPVQNFIKLIFDSDMFKDSMASFNLDAKKMPLGKLSKTQIARGFEVLEELKDVVSGKKKGDVAAITSRFYTLIPHEFGRNRPPLISTEAGVQEKMDMLAVLADIEMAQQMRKSAEDSTSEDHPDYLHYKSLQCDLEHVKPTSKEFKIIEKYVKNTSSYRNKIIDVMRMDRHGEDKRFAAHDDLENRRLLWHGTNVSVVAAIARTGLRIMPHSGGRVGRGIYLASEHSKSSGYVWPATVGKKRIGIMFLVEAALGKEHHITRDNSSLKAAPSGHHSVIAKGSQEPNPKEDTVVEFDGRKVAVPQGKPAPQPAYKGSYFNQTEYLVYKESQARLRYVIMFEF